MNAVVTAGVTMFAPPVPAAVSEAVLEKPTAVWLFKFCAVMVTENAAPRICGDATVVKRNGASLNWVGKSRRDFEV